MAKFKGTAGDDNLTGTSGNDSFDLTKGGNDTAFGGDGNDKFNMGAALNAADRIDGGNGTDVVNLKGDYSAGLVLDAATIVNIEKIDFFAGFDYDLTMNDGNVAAGQRLTVNGGSLKSLNHLIFDGSAETDGSYAITGGAGDDVLTGGALRDAFNLGRGGNDIVHAGGGNDTITMNAALTSADQIDGGAGNDVMTLDGGYTGASAVVLGASTMTNVETLQFFAGHNYVLTTNDANVAAGATLTVDASLLASNNSLTFNGAAESDGRFAFIGGAGADVLTGGNAGNTFDLTLGGHDTANGGLGVNVFNLGAAFDTSDRINGASGGSNTLILNGAYSGLSVTNTMAVNIQTLEIQGSNTLSLTWRASPALTLDASAAGGSLSFNAATLGNALHFIGGALNTQITAGAGNDTFDAGLLVDSFAGGGGNDVFNFGANLTAADSIDGGSGSNTLTLNGDYSAGLTFGAATMVNVQTLTLANGHDYNLTTDDATVASGQILSVNASALSASHHLVFNGQAESNGAFAVTGGAGSDTITGGAQADTFDLSRGGNDTVHAGASNDVIALGAALTAADSIDGGAGSDTLTLNGDYSAGIVFSASTIANVETLQLASGHSYNLTANNANVASGQTMTVDASALGAANALTFNGAAEADGSFVLIGGAGNDVLTGGNAGNTFDLTHGGSDAANGGQGVNVFNLGAAFDSGDHINGAIGASNTLILNGAYFSLDVTNTMAANIQTVDIQGINTTSIIWQEAATAPMTLDASAAGGSLTFDYSAVNASLHFIGGALNTHITGGNAADTFDAGTATDIFAGGQGDDTFNFAGNLTASDQVDGGTGNDTLTLDGDYSAGLAFGATTMVNVEALTLKAGHDYNLTINNATVASGQTLSVDASALGAANHLTFNAGAESDGFLAITGGAGTDTVTFAGNLVAADHIDGGAGSDTLVLNGDYSAGLVFGAGTVVNVETLTLAAGHSYNLTTSDTTVAAGQTMTVNAGALSASNALSFNAAAETDGFFSITAGAGGDTVTFGGNFSASDHVDGGAGSDTLVLNGDYSAGLTLSATMMVNVESLHLAAGHSYNLTTSDANVASGQTLAIDASALAAANALTFNGAAETDGFFSITGGAGGDTASFAGNFTASDHVDGGAGSDTLVLNGDYSAGLVFGASTMVNVETLTLSAGHDYNLTTDNATVASGQTLTVDASALAAANHVTFDASAETDGFLTVLGGAGNDTAIFGSGFAAADHVDGGAGSDTLALDGDYSAGFVFGASTIANIETLQLAAGHSYNLTTNDANIASGQSLTVDGSALGAAGGLIFNGAAETDGSFAFIGGAGSDTLTGGAQADSFDLGKGGSDTAHGAGGNDTFLMGAALAAADSIDGGTGSDTLVLNGDYSGGVTLGAATLTSIETMQFAAGHAYNLTTDDGNVASGATLTVDGSALGAGDSLAFNGAAETNGVFAFTGGAGNDALSGGAQADTFNLTLGGNDTAHGGGGNDTFLLDAALNASDSIDGGAGTDTLQVGGDYSAGVVFGAATIANIETMLFGVGHSYNFTTNDGNIAAGQTLTVDGSQLGASDSLVFNGAAETDGSFAFIDGAGDDTLTGGGQSDNFVLTHGGNDTAQGGGGSDTFILGSIFTAGDNIDGGAGSDSLFLNGDYSAGMTFTATTIANIETLSLTAGNSYNFTTADGNVTPGGTMTVDASALGAANTLTFNGAAETHGSFAFLAGAGNDVLSGGAQADSFTMTAGGVDTVQGGGGNDTFNFGATLSAADTIDGGAGSDTVSISGTGYGSFVFGATTMTNVETLILASNNNYGLTVDEATVTAGQTLTVNASALTIGHSLNFVATADTDGTFTLIGGSNGGIDAFFAGNFTAADQFQGTNSGADILNLNGDYSAGIVFNANTIVGVDQILLSAGHSYEFTTNDGNVLAGHTLFVTGSNLGAGDSLTFDGSAETNGFFNLSGGAGNDTIVMGAAFNLNDFFNGGAGIDTLSLNGDYSAGMTLTATNIANFEVLALAGGHSYNFTTNDGTVAAGTSFTVDASTLGAGDTLTLNGNAETNGSFNVIAGAGNDTLTGGAQADTFDLTHGGNDTAHAGGGNDTLLLGATLTAADAIDGGTGTDTVSLVGDYSGGLVLSATTLTNVETLTLGAGHSYNLTTNDATVASGITFTVNGSALGASDNLVFNGAAETNGSFAFMAGAGNDTLTGGALADTFTFAANLTAADSINGGAGNDSVSLNGDYSAGLTFGATTMVNVETLTLAAGHSYNLTTNDATVASGATLTIDASALGAGNTLTFDGSAETNGFFSITGGAGNDTLTIGAGLHSTSVINGGAGSDTLIFDASITLSSFTVTGIETFRFAAGHNYNVSVTDSSPSGIVTVDGSALGAADTLTFSTSTSTASFSMTGGAGNDHFSASNAGSTAANSFDMTHGGDDSVAGGFGNDTFNFGASLTAADHVDGIAGNDTLTLNGDYSVGITFSATTIVDIDTVTLAAGHSYNITVNQANLASNASMTYDGSALGAGDTLTFNGTAETDGTLTIKGGAGNDVITTGGNSIIDISKGGNDTVHGGSGSDTINCGAALTNSDFIDGGGGAGRDFVNLTGDYSAGLVLADGTLNNIEGMSFGAGFNYNITTPDSLVGPAVQFLVGDSALGAANSLRFDGSAETDGSFVFTDGAGNDTLIGGMGSDQFNLTGGGSDTAIGGIGNETFNMNATLSAGDNIDGGSGNDTLNLSGDYSAGVVFGATTLVSIETINLNAGSKYNFTFSDGTIAAGAMLTLNANAVTQIILDDSAETDGTLHATGLSSGNDTYIFGAGFITSNDQINANTGFDTLKLNGDFSSGFTFGAATAVGFEELVLVGGHSYNLTTNDATVASGVNFVVDASGLGVSDTLTFNGSAETDGSFTITGGAGNDVLTGSSGTDTFDISLGGNDTVHGSGGADTVLAGSAFTADDSISNVNKVVLNGDYSGGLVLSATTLVNVGGFQLMAGHSYNITTGNFLSGTIDASALGASDTLIFNGGGEINGGFDITGGAGNDVLTGGGGGNTFDLSKGGIDTVHGGNGSDTFIFAGTFTDADTVDAGAGNDSLSISGGYTGTLSSVTSIEALALGSGIYSITENDNLLSAGQTLVVTTSGTTSLVFNGGAETDGAFNFTGTNGNDILTGGALADTFNMAQSGTDVVRGGGGDDTISMGTSFSVADQIDGGAGNDTVSIGFNSGPVFVNPQTFTNVETLILLANGSAKYQFTMDDNNVAAGATMTINATATLSTDTVSINASAETDGHYNFIAGSFTETFVGGALADTFDLTKNGTDTVTGGGGADSFMAGNAQDTFVYVAVSNSTSTGYDTIAHLNFSNDRFNVSSIGAVTGVDAAVTTGALSTATFDSDLASDVGSGQLAAHHAMLFTADSGTLAGHTFLIVDENGVAGYQAGADLVIDVTGANGGLTTFDFI